MIISHTVPTLKESVQQFVSPVYARINRSVSTYQTVTEHCSQQITDLVNEYHNVINDQQLLREIRNDIDYYLRRYHEYCIKQRNGMGAHYCEVGADTDTDFEHLIPAARIRDLVLAKVITVEQGLNSPTVVLSREKHIMLKDAGWASKTPDMWLPFTRYTNVFDATFETYDGTVVDPTTWTLDTHYNYFKHLML